MPDSRQFPIAFPFPFKAGIILKNPQVGNVIEYLLANREGGDSCIVVFAATGEPVNSEAGYLRDQIFTLTRTKELEDGKPSKDNPYGSDSIHAICERFQDQVDNIKNNLGYRLFFAHVMIVSKDELKLFLWDMEINTLQNDLRNIFQGFKKRNDGIEYSLGLIRWKIPEKFHPGLPRECFSGTNGPAYVLGFMDDLGPDDVFGAFFDHIEVNFRQLSSGAMKNVRSKMALLLMILGNMEKEKQKEEKRRGLLN